MHGAVRPTESVSVPVMPQKQIIFAASRLSCGKYMHHYKTTQKSPTVFRQGFFIGVNLQAGVERQHKVATRSRHFIHRGAIVPVVQVIQVQRHSVLADLAKITTDGKIERTPTR